MNNDVKAVYITADCYQVCMLHAFSTEREEIMGLLMGEIDSDDIIQISAMLMLRRSDKRKDRVEIPPEQLTLAADHAENLSKELKRPIRVVGWYHSHPHITVLPSVVDCRTQSTYQYMDYRFIGLIFSVFAGESKKPDDQLLQIICFQSLNDDNGHKEVELYVIPESNDYKYNNQRMLELPNILYDEELEQYSTYEKDAGSLHSVHNATVFSSSLLHSMSIVESPLLYGLREKERVLEWLTKKQSLNYDLKLKQLNTLKSSTKNILKNGLR